MTSRIRSPAPDALRRSRGALPPRAASDPGRRADRPVPGPARPAEEDARRKIALLLGWRTDALQREGSELRGAPALAGSERRPPAELAAMLPASREPLPPVGRARKPRELPTGSIVEKAFHELLRQCAPKVRSAPPPRERVGARAELEGMLPAGQIARYEERLRAALWDPRAIATFEKLYDHSGLVLDRTPFEPWPLDPLSADPSVALGTFEEPAIASDDARHPVGAGVVILESGCPPRVWVREPSGHFAGVDLSFPKGKVEGGQKGEIPTVEALRRTAVREAWEEVGLAVRLVGHLADVEHRSGPVRYYLGVRGGGDPARTDFETYKVMLSPLDKLAFAQPADRKVQAAIEAHVAATGTTSVAAALDAHRADFPEARRRLVVLDLDETTITSPGPLGNEKWSEWLAQAYDRPSAEHRALVGAVRAHLRYVPTEPELPGALERLRACGWEIVGLTARGIDRGELTERNLSDAGLAHLFDAVILRPPRGRKDILRDHIARTQGPGAGTVGVLFIDDLPRNVREVSDLDGAKIGEDTVTLRAIQYLRPPAFDIRAAEAELRALADVHPDVAAARTRFLVAPPRRAAATRPT